MKPTDYVARWCVVGDKTCSLKAKCDVCKKEIADLNAIDQMFENRIFDLVCQKVENEKNRRVALYEKVRIIIPTNSE